MWIYIGVYKIEIDSKQHKVVVTGNIESGTLIKKLIRSGKTAELWPDDAAAADKKTDEADGPKKEGGGESSGEDGEEEKGGGQAPPAQVGGGGGKKKKKKKKKKGNAGAGNAGGAPAPAPAAQASEAAGGLVGDPANGGSPRQQAFSYPQFYYPAAAEYGMSYSNAPAPPAASMAASYYSLPMCSYAYLSPRSADSIYGYDDRRRGDEEIGCSITWFRDVGLDQIKLEYCVIDYGN